MKQQSTRLGIEKISSLMINLSVPAFIGMFVMSLYNIVDAIFVARGVGTLGVAALSIAFPIQMIMGALAGTFGIGGASIISRRLGANALGEANRVFNHIIWLIVFFSMLMTATAFLFLEPLLVIFGATKNILPYAKDFLSIILLGSVFVTFAMATNNVVRSEGNAKIAMLTMVMSAVINMILNPIFIFGLDMGIKGSATATVIAQFIAATWLLKYFIGGKSSLTLKWIGFIPDFKVVKEIILIGLPSFIMMSSSSLMVVSVNWMLLTLVAKFILPFLVLLTG
ncbi:MATE family efflux transporter [Desulfoscipio geothermicus]|uniref:Putative efflux protein, MATE family n=1 Tax=Desulfoscipio geothermicus DSM 3669 TaxID=1121426 RepID=A0A1I6CR44_9FIRM|nr:MATE family efflux transporter [Desulfoscipio geothermicus]SFQ95651.1 putative efflux protein, MATE family [Desulfoscipio geothermicus DSM 3669]